MFPNPICADKADPESTAKLEAVAGHRFRIPNIRDALLANPTDPAVLARLEAAARRPVTPREYLEQRLSPVYRAMRDEFGMTREQVRQLMAGCDAGIMNSKAVE